MHGESFIVDFSLDNRAPLFPLQFLSVTLEMKLLFLSVFKLSAITAKIFSSIHFFFHQRVSHNSRLVTYDVGSLY